MNFDRYNTHSNVVIIGEFLWMTLWGHIIQSKIH
jgi:hypothetical protein